MKSIDITIGGEPRTVSPRRLGAEQKWREEFQKRLARIAGVVFADLAQAQGGLDLRNLSSLSLEEGSKIVGLVEGLGGSLLGAIDDVAELVVLYAPEELGPLERLQAEAYTEEVIVAFIKIVRTVYPFGALKAIVEQIGALTGNGRAPRPTSPSSSSPSGISLTRN